MSGLEVLIGLAGDFAVRTVRDFLRTRPWAKDEKKASYVEGHIRTLTADAASFVRSGLVGDDDRFLDPLLDRFKGDLVTNGIPPEDAIQITDQQRRILMMALVEPERNLSAQRARVARLEEELEALRTGQAEQVKALQGALATNHALLRQNLALTMIGAISLVALVLSILALVRHP